LDGKNQNDKRRKHRKTAAIAGGVISGVAGALIIAAAAWYFLYYSRRPAYQPQPSSEELQDRKEYDKPELDSQPPGSHSPLPYNDYVKSELQAAPVFDHSRKRQEMSASTGRYPSELPSNREYELP
jgi:uncharacterized iron-regulated membrane protein